MWPSKGGGGCPPSYSPDLEALMTNGKFRNISDLPPVIPVFPLSGVLMLPHSQLPLNIFEPRYLALVDDALKGDRLIGIIQPTEDPDTVLKPGLSAIGAAGRIVGA